MKTVMQVMRAMLLLGLWLGGMQAAQAQTRTVHLYYTDPQGTPLVKTDAQGNIIAQYDYTPYGDTVASLGSPPDGPGYTGHVNDPKTGLVYMQARYYHPDGRFLSPDPVEPTPGNIYSFNRYAYASNNPIVNIDPDGRQDAALEEQPRPPPPSALDRLKSAASNMFHQLVTDMTTMSGTNPNATITDAVLAPIRTAMLASPLALEGGAARVITVESETTAEGAFFSNASSAASADFGASSATSGLNLNKALASQAQMGEAGKAMSGAGTQVPFRGASRAADVHGGNAGDWAKMTSSSYAAKDGATFETHWLENSSTGQRVEYKTKLVGGN